MVMTAIRWMLGKIILLVDALTSPKPLQRSADEQQVIDAATAKLTLYHFNACPFCVKVRREIKRYNLNIESRDVKRNAQAHEELLKGGGKIQVPCLRIEQDNNEVVWLYESSEIILYLKNDLLKLPAEQTTS